MSSKSLSILVAIGAVAFASNPNEQSFQRYIDQQMKQEGKTSWIERKLVSHVSALIYERRDFKFFSIVDVPEEQRVFIGVFGVWMLFPRSLGELREVFTS